MMLLAGRAVGVGWGVGVGGRRGFHRVTTDFWTWVYVWVLRELVPGVTVGFFVEGVHALLWRVAEVVGPSEPSL